MKWLRKICRKLIYIYWGLVGMDIPVITVGGSDLIDASKVEGVILHHDGEKFYYSAIVNGSLVFIAFSMALKNWFRLSKIFVRDVTGMWNEPIPVGEELVEPQNIPVTTKEAKLKS